MKAARTCAVAVSEGSETIPALARRDLAQAAAWIFLNQGVCKQDPLRALSLSSARSLYKAVKSSLSQATRHGLCCSLMGDFEDEVDGSHLEVDTVC